MPGGRRGDRVMANTLHSSSQVGDVREGVAIVGLGGAFPGAKNVAEFWKNICAGHVAIAEVPPGRWAKALYHREDRKLPDVTYSAIGGFLGPLNFDHKRFRLPPKIL